MKQYSQYFTAKKLGSYTGAIIPYLLQVGVIELVLYQVKHTKDPFGYIAFLVIIYTFVDLPAELVKIARKTTKKLIIE